MPLGNGIVCIYNLIVRSNDAHAALNFDSKLPNNIAVENIQP